MILYRLRVVLSGRII